MTATSNQDVGSYTVCDYWSMVAIKTEVRYMWKRPSNLSGYVFFLHRYFNALAMPFVFWSLFSSGKDVSCQALVNLREGLLIFAQLIVVFILTLRICALYGCERRTICIWMTVLTVFLTTVSSVATFYGRSGLDTPSTTCRNELDFEASIRQGLAWATLFVYDTIVFVLALYNAIKTRKELRILRQFRVSLKVILLRDGLYERWTSSARELYIRNIGLSPDAKPA
ncbi:hypothetical protein WG66_014628 [Moniliophthora roreri]|nr:hypothetical protein WG66_014628 [Moniliophthora roreri]